MAAIRSASFGAIASIGLAWACGGAGAFACNDDAQCEGTDELGFCEASGYCSFADAACPSGRRYGARAPDDLARQCVEPDQATSIAEDDDGSAEDGVTDPGSTGTTGPSSDSSATSPTTTPVDPTTGGDATATVTSDTGATETGGSSSHGEAEAEAEAESTTMIEPMDPPCEPTFVDDFEDGVIDPFWDSWIDAVCTLEESNGHLEMTVGAAPMPGDWPSTGLYSLDTVSMLGGHARVELVPFAPPLDIVGVWLTLVDPNQCELQIAAYATEITGRSGDVYLDGVPAATDEPLWLQIRVDSDAVAHWEWSTDGSAWTELHSEPSPCDMSVASVAVFAGDEHQSLSPPARAVEWLERCEAP